MYIIKIQTNISRQQVSPTKNITKERSIGGNCQQNKDFENMENGE